MITAGILTALGFLVLFWKLGFRRFRLFEVPIDLGVTAIMALLFWGTFSGMMTAIVGGLVFSLLFRVAVKT